jgi:hypothetical protein
MISYNSASVELQIIHINQQHNTTSLPTQHGLHTEGNSPSKEITPSDALPQRFGEEIDWNKSLGFGNIHHNKSLRLLYKEFLSRNTNKSEGKEERKVVLTVILPQNQHDMLLARLLCRDVNVLKTIICTSLKK